MICSAASPPFIGLWRELVFSLVRGGCAWARLGEERPVSSRLLQIARVAARHRLDALASAEALAASDIPRSVRWALRAWPGRWLPAPRRSPAVRLRLAFEALGPVFIKFGQLLSTRRDMLPPDYAEELAKLQDHVPPFPGEQARALVEAALGADFEARIGRFDIEPLASASIAQVHGAVLTDGAEVVAKVVRPDIEGTMRADLEVLARLAGWIDRHIAASRRLRLPEVAADYAGTVLKELDMVQEAANTQRLRENFAGSDLLYVPQVHHDLTRPNLLVLERVKGVPVSQVETLKERGTDLALLARRGVETFFTQVFVHNFFHADMHPGNIFVDVQDPKEPHYIALDCAIIGQLSERDQDYLARNLLAFFNRDYRQVARLHLESGWVPQNTDEAEFERVIREVCDPIFAKPLTEISFGNFLVDLFRTAAEFDMEIQPQLVLLQKTLLYVEGVGRQLYPQLDLWETAKPFMERWMGERVGPLATMRRFAERAPDVFEQLPRLPELIADTGRTLRRLESGMKEQQKRTSKLEEAFARGHRRRRGQRAVGALLAGLAVVLLWGPLSQAFSDSLTVFAGLLSAAASSYLLVRA